MLHVPMLMYLSYWIVMAYGGAWMSLLISSVVLGWAWVSANINTCEQQLNTESLHVFAGASVVRYPRVRTSRRHTFSSRRLIRTTRLHERVTGLQHHSTSSLPQPAPHIPAQDGRSAAERREGKGNSSETATL